MLYRPSIPEVEDPLGSRVILDFLFGALAATVLIFLLRVQFETEDTAQKLAEQSKMRADQVRRGKETYRSRGTRAGILPELPASVLLVYDCSGSVHTNPGFFDVYLELLEEILRRHPEVKQLAIILDSAMRPSLVSKNGEFVWESGAVEFHQLIQPGTRKEENGKSPSGIQREKIFYGAAKTFWPSFRLGPHGDNIANVLLDLIPNLPPDSGVIFIGDGDYRSLSHNMATDSGVNETDRKAAHHLGDALTAGKIHFHGVLLSSHLKPATPLGASQFYGRLARQSRGSLVVLPGDYSSRGIRRRPRPSPPPPPVPDQIIFYPYEP